MTTLEAKELDKKKLTIFIVNNIFMYLFLGLFFLYFTTLNPNSEGYINVIPNYFIFILFFLIFLYSIKLIYDAKVIHNSFKVIIDGDQLIVEQKINPKHTIINMKEVKRIVQNKKGHITFYKEGETVFDNLFAIDIKVIKNEEELIQYVASYQEVILEKCEDKEEKKFRTRSIIIQVVLALVLLFFFMTKSIYFIIPITFFIASVTYMGFQEKGEKIELAFLFLSLFAMIKLGCAVWYIFM